MGTVGLARPMITAPEQQFGFNIGDDHRLVNYTQLADYWRRLDGESERMAVEVIGKTAEGRSMIMAIITAPENHRKLQRLKEIARRMALAEGISEGDARAMAREGRAVVWIDGGLHGTEVVGAQQLIEMAYQMVSREDAETLRFLQDVVLLLACANPDGMELVSNWYMRNPDPERRSLDNLPRLYQKYIGHDNNRDFYMSTQPETEAINRVFYHDWFPQIVYNHHQSGPPGTVLFAPPFRDPFNYHFDPLIPVGIDLVGAAMHNRFVLEGKAGATMRSGAGYSTWYNGGLRTTTYFHNMIGLLTEMIGSPTPMEIPFVPDRQLPRGDLPMPIAPQPWHFRQSIEYSITANRSVLDVASKYREEFLFNIYRMGRNSIERGSRDSWTMSPRKIDAVLQRLASAGGRAQGEAARERVGATRTGIAPRQYFEQLKDPRERDARSYVIPADQPDFLTATKFVNALIKAGIVVHRATSAFEVAGKGYPAGSYVVRTAQAFRPHILDMFEPQDHPNDLMYPGGPPRPTYDSAGWTLAYQMGVRFDRILEGFEGPLERISGFAKAPPGSVEGAREAAGFVLSHDTNDSFHAVNRLLAAGDGVFWLATPIRAGGISMPAGTMYIPKREGTVERLRQIANDVGLNFLGLRQAPDGEMLELRNPRIGLWDRYGGSIASGWIRWLLEQFEFPFDVVYAPDLDAGGLAARFDVLIFPDGAIPPVRSGDGQAEPGGRMGAQDSIDPMTIPPEYRGRLGSVTAGKTMVEIRNYLEAGGSVIAMGSSTNIAYHLGLPLGNALVERRADGTESPLPRERFYIPGSLIRARVVRDNPLAYGVPDPVDVFFASSPVFRLRPDAALRGVRPIVWYEGGKTLRSGWAIGEGYLDQGVAVAEASAGRGRVFLLGPDVTFRGQAHGTFKFLFNAIFCGQAVRSNS
ncbi:MAG: peptidase [Acidobacteria bacterium]|nr:peptidase [Acidobacteriota bacterium]